MSYSFPNLEPVSCFMSGSNCCFLTLLKFPRRQLRWSDTPIFLRIFHSLLLSPQSSFRIVNEADVFLEFLCFLYDPVNVANLISGSSTFSKLRDLILKACWGDDIFLSCHALISSDGSNIYSNPSGESVSCGNI